MDSGGWDEKTMVFVCGLHRSGTTLLWEGLARHPETSRFQGTGARKDEGQLLQDVMTNDQHHGGAGIFGFRSAARLTEQSSLVSDASRRRLLSQWGPHWDATKPLLLEKSPPNLIRMRFLQALFPSAMFVILTRHPVATAMATHKWKWRRATVAMLIKHWVVCHEFAREDLQYLRRFCWVRYEDFVVDPRRELGRVMNMMGRDAPPSIVDVRHGVNRKYFEAFSRRTSGWLRRRLWSRFVDRWHARVTPFGYDLNDLETLDEIAFATSN